MSCRSISISLCLLVVDIKDNNSHFLKLSLAGNTEEYSYRNEVGREYSTIWTNHNIARLIMKDHMIAPKKSPRVMSSLISAIFLDQIN